MNVHGLLVYAIRTAAVDPTILSSFVLDERLIVMVRWTVREGGPLCHMKVGDLQGELGFGVAQHRLSSGETRVFPPPETVLSPGDEVLVQGPYDELVALESRDLDGQALESYLRLTH
jgi:Trk K+ transport system NAD-binding subunit